MRPGSRPGSRPPRARLRSRKSRKNPRARADGAGCGRATYSLTDQSLAIALPLAIYAGLNGPRKGPLTNIKRQRGRGGTGMANQDDGFFRELEEELRRERLEKIWRQ